MDVANNAHAPTRLWGHLATFCGTLVAWSKPDCETADPGGSMRAVAALATCCSASHYSDRSLLGKIAPDEAQTIQRVDLV